MPTIRIERVASCKHLIIVDGKTDKSTITYEEAVAYKQGIEDTYKRLEIKGLL